MDICSFRDRRRISTLNIEPSFKTRKASSNGMSYVNTQLAKHKDDEAPFTHWIQINDRARDGLRFQSRILHKQRGIEVEWVTALDIWARKRAKRRKSDKSREQERFCLIWRNKYRHSQSTDNRFQCGLKNGLQTDRQTDGQTKYIFTVWQTLSFQSREQVTFIEFRFTRL